MKKSLICIFAALLCIGASAQELRPEWEALTSTDFSAALAKSDSVCIIPMGVIEKHGPHMPVGTDVLNAHGVSVLAAAQEYCVVYPFYYFGQINEARHTLGTVAYSPELVYRMLEETCEEVARNGFKKIILYNCHGGNNALVTYFCQNQLNRRHDYVVYGATHRNTPERAKEIAKMRKSKTGGHADELETASIMVLHPGYVKLEYTGLQSGEDQERLSLQNLQPGIWWYASYPNHYAGDASQATEELGRKVVDGRVEVLVKMIRDVKADNAGPALQKEYFDKVDNLLN